MATQEQIEALKIDENVFECVIRPIPVHFPGAIQSPNEA